MGRFADISIYGSSGHEEGATSSVGFMEGERGIRYRAGVAWEKEVAFFPVMADGAVTDFGQITGILRHVKADGSFEKLHACIDRGSGVPPLWVVIRPGETCWTERKP